MGIRWCITCIINYMMYRILVSNNIPNSFLIAFTHMSLSLMVFAINVISFFGIAMKMTAVSSGSMRC